MLVVLGSPNDPLGRLSSMALERLRHAQQEHTRHPDYPILLTGGFGEHFNQSALPHAAHARGFLVSQGVPRDAFVEFALSTNTIEDAALSRPIVERIAPASLVVITSDFHLDRVRHVFDHTFATPPLDYIGAPHACSDEARQQLKRHEASALARLRGSGSLRFPR